MGLWVSRVGPSWRRESVQPLATKKDVGFSLPVFRAYALCMACTSGPAQNSIPPQRGWKARLGGIVTNQSTGCRQQ